MTDKYLIWSNEHGMWWGANESGYTNDVKIAGRYNRDHAIEICQAANVCWDLGRNPNELPIPEGDAIELAPIRGI